MKLNKLTLANTFALATAKLWLLCSIFVVLFPDISLTITQWWMHGMSMKVMGSWNLNLTNFLLGGITIVISAWITGWIFAWSWEKVNKK